MNQYQMNKESLKDLLAASSEAAYASEYKDPRGPFRLSLAGTCLRRLCFMLTGAEEDTPTPRILLARRFGTILHEELAAIVPLTGKESTVALSFDGVSTSLLGHVDGIYGDGVVDYKTTTERGYYALLRAEKEGREALLEQVGEPYLCQLACYVEASSSARGYLVYLNKNTMAFFIAEFSAEELAPYLESAKARFRALQEFADHWEAEGRNVEPPESFREHDPIPEVTGRGKSAQPTGRMVLPWQCDYCNSRSACWPQATLSLDSNKPKYIV